MERNVSSKMQICPRCGAGIVGETAFCPRCDQPLSYAPSSQQHDEREGVQPVRAPLLDEDTRQQAPLDQLILEESMAPQNLEEAVTAAVPQDMIGVTARGPEDEPTVSTFVLPPAPYTPPPINPALTSSVVPYSYPSNYYLQQRIDAYRRAGYSLAEASAYEASLSFGKPLSLLWWLLAMFSGVGIFWYLLILLTSGFSKDRVFLVMERDGTLYEDGAGAAHTRQRRARSGERWGLLGVIMFFVALVVFALLIAIGAAGVSRYKAELQAAYPTISAFAGADYQSTVVDPDDIITVKNAVLVYLIIFTLTGIGIIGGLTLTIVGYLHNAAYRVKVPPMPEAG